MRLPVVLVWSPQSLADVALECSGLAATLYGGLSAGITAAVFLAGVGWPMNEPFGSVGMYVRNGLWGLVFGSALFVPVALVAAALVVLASLRRDLPTRAVARAFVLAPVALV